MQVHTGEGGAVAEGDTGKKAKGRWGRRELNHVGTNCPWRKHHNKLDKRQGKLDALQIKEVRGRE
jgi:hypothetical protein